MKFCPKCGFKQPDDREAYELEHPELADALPEDEILEKLEHASIVPRTAMSREEFVESIASDPHRESIIKMVDEGLEKFELSEKSDQERWLAKCAALIGDKQGFYPYFVMLLSQKYEMARDLLFNQASYGMEFAQKADDELPPELPPPLPARDSLPPLASQEGSLSNNTGYIQPAPALPPFTDGSGTSVICPICHNHLSPGTTECPFCHQLLDWSDADSQSHKVTNEKSVSNYIWILPVAIIAVLILIICFTAAQCDRSSKKRDYLDDTYLISTISVTEQVEDEVPSQISVPVEEDYYYDYPAQEADDYDYDEYGGYDESADEYDPYEDDEYDYDDESYYGY